MRPSAEDLDLTACCAEMGRGLGVAVLDHLIVGAGQWLSGPAWLAAQERKGIPPEAGTA